MHAQCLYSDMSPLPVEASINNDSRHGKDGVDRLETRIVQEGQSCNPEECVEHVALILWPIRNPSVVLILRKACNHQARSWSADAMRVV